MMCSPWKITAAAAVMFAWSCGAVEERTDRVFSRNWQNDGGRSIAQLQHRLRTTKPPASASVAIGVTRAGLVGAVLDRGGTWQHTGAVDAQPEVTGNVVVVTGGGKLLALDAITGKRLWEVSSKGRALRGAGDDGAITVASLGKQGGGGSLLLAIDRNGRVLLELEPQQEIGSPAALGGVLFVPWGSQYVSALDANTGRELARLSLHQVTNALNLGGELYFGQTVLVHFDDAIGRAPQGGARKVSLPRARLPGDPEWLRAGNRVTPPAASVRSKTRLYALPSFEAGKLGIEQGRYLATYYRIMLDLSADRGALQWVRTSAHDMIGGAAAHRGFVLCDESGKLTMLDERGGDAGERELGQPVVGCVVQAASLGIAEGRSPGPLREQIARALELREAELAPIQKLLLEELNRLADPEVTKTLIDLAENPRTTNVLLEEARKLLATRRTGKEHMLRTLEKHYDFLEQVLRPPPIGPLADALAAMNAQEAAAPLARHLNDPANTPDDVMRAARALEKLATAEQKDDLVTFFSLYRATADSPELISAVVSAAKALMRVGRADEKQHVMRAAEDPLTHPEVKRALVPLLLQRTDQRDG